jgi:hypothetical protein
MLVGGVGIDLIDDDLEAEPVRFVQQPVEIGKRAEDRIDIAIVRDVVAEFFIGEVKKGDSQMPSTPSEAT